MKKMMSVLVLCVSFGAAGCGADEEAEAPTAPAASEPAAEASGEVGAAAAEAEPEAEPEPATAGDAPSAGDSCRGEVSAASALMACNGQSLLFCSSYTGYEWREQRACPEGTACTVAEDQTSGGCQ